MYLINNVHPIIIAGSDDELTVDRFNNVDKRFDFFGRILRI